MDMVDNLVQQFKITELIKIAEFFGLAPTSRWPDRKLVDAINMQIDKVGIPKPNQEPNDFDLLVEDYLYVAGFIDEELHPKDSRKEDGELEEFLAKHNIAAVPDCYGGADDANPACRTCVLFRFCASTRLANLPPCFGILFQDGHPECVECVEAPFCKAQLKSKSALIPVSISSE